MRKPWMIRLLLEFEHSHVLESISEKGKRRGERNLVVHKIKKKSY